MYICQALVRCKTLILNIILINFYGSVFSQNFIDYRWNKVTSPMAASIRSFAEGKNNVYYAGSTSGIYKSEDGGDSWRKAGLEEYNIDEIFVTEKGTLLAGTYRAGMFRSEDAGNTWTPAGFDKNIYLFKIIQDKNKTIYTTASFVVDGLDKSSIPTGVFKSTDDGKSWQQTSLKSDDIFGLSNPIPGLLFAYGKSGLFASGNNGETWKKYGSGLPDAIPVSKIISFKKSLFASVGNRQDASGQTGGGIFRSDDEGLTWVRSDKGISRDTKINEIISHRNVLFVCSGSLNGSRDQGIYKSIDNGRTWSFTGLDLVVRLLRKTSGNMLVAGTDGSCLFLSKDFGKTWRQSGKEFDNWETFKISSDTDFMYVSDHNGRVWKAKENTEEWESITNGVVALTPTGRLITFFNNEVLTSDDKGINWQVTAKIQASFVLFKSLNDTLIVGCSNKGFFYSEDNGQSWNTYNISGLTNAQFRTAIITPKGTIVAGYRSDDQGNGIIRSADGGKSWQKVNQRLFVWELLYKEGIIYAGNYAEGVYISNDDGLTWTASNIGLKEEREYTTVTSLEFIDYGLLCGILGKGIYISADKGVSWKPYNSGLSNLNIWDIVKGEEGKIHTATQKGIFQLLDK